MANMEAENNNIFKFKDDYLKVTPDPFYEYPASLREERTPIIIDNGCYQCKVGWANEDRPKLVFKNILTKQRGKKESELQIGNDIGNIEVVRWLLKTQFDRDLVTHFEAQEQIFDYTFSHLGINSEGSVDHPIVLTEPVCNPNYCRSQMSELLFECYGVPKLAYGIDSLFSYLYNARQQGFSSRHGMVLSSGFQTSHVLPVVDGCLDALNAKRINLGGSQVTAFLHKILQLKYPAHLTAITLSRAEEMVTEHCYLAEDYFGELEKWSSTDYYEANVHKFQLPYTQLAGSTVSAKDKEERRQQQVRRLQELNAKKREEKLAAETEKIKQLINIQELLEDEDEEAFNKALENMGYSSAQELQATINKLNLSIRKIKEKMLNYSSVQQSGGEEAVDVTAVGRPLEAAGQLGGGPRKRSLRIEARVATRGTTALGAGDPDQSPPSKRGSTGGEVDDGQAAASTPVTPATPPDQEKRSVQQLELWISDLKRQRQDLLDTKAQKRQLKAELAKRKSQASAQRMRILTQLAHNSGTGKNKEDTFGMNDDDWEVYKSINREGGDSDSEEEQEKKLAEIEQLLRENDPKFEKVDGDQSVATPYDIAEFYQLHLGVERLRVPELIFQPSMLGMEQGGLADTLEYTFSKYAPETQDQMAQSIFLTGGNTMFTGIQRRIEHELLAMRPFQSTFRVYTAEDALFDAWKGAKLWIQDISLSDNGYLTKAEYEEKGSEYLREHCTSNRYNPTPQPQ